MSTRAENVRRLRELRAERPDMDTREIAASLGLSVSTVNSYRRDPTGERTAALRAGYAGRCEVCGGKTTGYGPGRSARRCSKCRRGGPGRKIWPREKIIDAIRAWVLTFGELPAVADWSPYQARLRGEEEKAARFRRLQKHGSVPSFQTVYNEFGSWNAAIEAAGFTPQPRGKTRDRKRPPKTHCVHGHRMTKANVYLDRDGHRHCRACRQKRSDQVAADRRGLLIAERG